MVCKKCKQIVPCHKIWFDTSKVLCPECYNGMTSSEIEKFHQEHPATTATYFEELENKGTEKIFRNTARLLMESDSYTPTDLPDSLSRFGNGMDTKTILHASKQELLEAVGKGILSKARFRIEMKRRKNKDYYNSLSDVEEIHI